MSRGNTTLPINPNWRQSWINLNDNLQLFFIKNKRKQRYTIDAKSGGNFFIKKMQKKKKKILLPISQEVLTNPISVNGS